MKQGLYKSTSHVSQRIGLSIFPPLYDASMALFSDINRGFREAGYTVSIDQFIILSGIYLGYGDSQKILADWLGRHQSVVSRLLSILEKNGWVERLPDANDSRCKRVELTSKAHDEWPALEVIVFQTILARCEGIEPEKLQICMDVLVQIFINCRPKQWSYIKTPSGKKLASA